MRPRDFRLGWSAWRRAHQAVAKRCKKASRAAKRALRTESGQAPHIPQRPPAGRRYNDHRTVLGGILWVARTGSSWREMPEEFGKWHSACRRYELWVEQGLWQRILGALGEEGLPGPATKEH